MNQYINALDEMIEEYSFDSARKYILEKARDKISSLPSDTQWIDTLQRYHEMNSMTGSEVEKYDTGEYVKYSDLKKLLED